MPAAGIPFTAFEASGFDRSHPASLAKGVAKIAASTGKAKKWFADIKPDVVVGFGGYVCIPVARAAEKTGVPVVLHEQNSVAGMANKYLARRADAVCVTYECSAESLGAAAPVTVTGNPVRRSVIEADRAAGRAMFDLAEDDFMLLVFGGSLGARHINEAVVALKDELLARPNLHIVHITGPKELDAVTEALALADDEARRWHLLGYQDRMGETLAAADAIVSRAGATSLAEISALAIPALLVPLYPGLEVLNIMHLATPASAMLAAIIYNALIIVALIPLALRGVKYREASPHRLLARNLAVYGLGGVIVPFAAIKALDALMVLVGVA